MKKTWIIVVVLAAFLAIIVAAGVIIKSRIKGGIEVQTESVERRDISQVVTAFGRLSPEVEVDISTKVIGQMEKLYVDEGDTVVKGDTLAELEKTRYLAALNSAQASLRSAKAQVDQVMANYRQASESLRKTTSMFDKGLVSEDALTRTRTETEVLAAQLASARDGVERARAAVDEVRDDLDRTTIIAPVSGVVVRLSAEVGENVITGTTNIPGSSIMTIAQLDAMEAVVMVDEADVVDLEIGQLAKIEVDAFPDTFLAGEVVKIANSASLQNIGGQETVANFEVKIAIDEAFRGIRPGMSCSSEIEVEQADSVLSVPIQAVVAARDEVERNQEKDKAERKGIKVTVGRGKSGERPARKGAKKVEEAVFVIENGIAKQRLVSTGIADDRYIEIKEGVERNERIVIGRYSALRELKDGDRVRTAGTEKGSGSWNVKFN